ncbi:MAG: carbohydrate kinase family protein, partial [Chloroflexi bacterium]
MVSGVRVVVVGDATLDVTLRPSQPLRPGSDVPARILVSPGGQGANVAVRLARQAIPVRLITALGTDAAGQLLRHELERERVELTGPSGATTGSVVSLVDSDGERSMASDRVPLDAAEMVAGVDAEWLHCSGYPIVDDRYGDALARALGQRPATTRLSIGGGSLQPEPRAAAEFTERLIHARPHLLLLGAHEAAALIGADEDSLSAAATKLAARLATGLPDLLVIVTGGSRGSAAAGAGLSIVEQAPPVEEPM